MNINLNILECWDSLGSIWKDMTIEKDAVDRNTN